MKPLLFCLLLTALSACAHSAEPLIDAIPVVRTGADIVLPLDRFQQTDDQRRLLAKAVDVVGDRCMRRFGLSWRGDPTPTPPISNARRYTNLDPAVASSSGYHAAESVVREPPAISADTMAVWLGEGAATFRGVPVPQGGCVGETMRQLKPGIERIEAGLPQKLQWQSFGLARQDSRVAAVFGRWRACMAGKGFHYQDTYAAANDPRWRTEHASPAEIATAVADVACKAQTNVAGVLHAVETAYQVRLIAEHRAALDAVMAYADKELFISRQIVEG